MDEYVDAGLLPAPDDADAPFDSDEWDEAGAGADADESAEPDEYCHDEAGVPDERDELQKSVECAPLPRDFECDTDGGALPSTVALEERL